MVAPAVQAPRATYLERGTGAAPVGFEALDQLR
jgi:hypothetical protein